MNTAEFPDILRQITRRYRAALAANLGVLAALSIGSVGVLAWRLHAVGLDRPWVVGIPTALGVVAVTGLGWRLKRRWMAGMGTASHLDRALGLQERLITAAEFAHRTPPPALYPLLLDDAAQHFSKEQVRLPRLVDRSGIVLAIILLLLFCWPGRGNVPMQLAQLPATPPPILPPQPQPPPEPKQQTPPQNQGGSSQSQSGGQQQADGQQDRNRSQPSAGGAQQSQPQGSGSNQQAGQSGRQPSEATPQSQGSDQQSQASNQQGRGDQGRGNGQQPGGQRPDAADRQQQAGRDHMNGEGKSQEPRRIPQTGDGRQETGDQKERNQKEQQERSRHDQTSGERGQQDGGQQQKGSAPQGNQQQTAGSDAQHTAEGAKPAGQQGSQGRDQTTQKTDRGGGQAAMNGDVTREQIQQLLKEVSGELKQLQVQLAAANDQPRPEAGTSTDPELYGPAEALDHAKGSPLPVQLGTDTVETKAQRPGGGVGHPAGKAASATPQTQAEDAQLSEQPLEETPAAHQTIPPEYRPVFERLQQQRDTTP